MLLQVEEPQMTNPRKNMQMHFIEVHIMEASVAQKQMHFGYRCRYNVYRKLRMKPDIQAC